MTPLRKRMIENMQLRGLSEGTQETYIRAIGQLSKHYGKSPEQITEQELRAPCARSSFCMSRRCSGV
jgi:hypothetical protein